ncbi:uncharacterized protein [Narcine bancroftii]|uniref:uncharacterized protein isoform X2 n=1 Tax=Narcine bancroftii TaxID=1343680 RepID=UPI0038321A4C
MVLSGFYPCLISCPSCAWGSDYDVTMHKVTELMLPLKGHALNMNKNFNVVAESFLAVSSTTGEHFGEPLHTESGGNVDKLSAEEVKADSNFTFKKNLDRHMNGKGMEDYGLDAGPNQPSLGSARVQALKAVATGRSALALWKGRPVPVAWRSRCPGAVRSLPCPSRRQEITGARQSTAPLDSIKVETFIYTT